MTVSGVTPDRDKTNEFPATLGHRGSLATVEYDPISERQAS